MFFSIKFLVCALLFHITTSFENCDKDLTHLVGTKTPYRVAANLNDSKIQFPGCEPIKLWMLVRHGTRNPNAKLIKLMQEKLPQIRDTIIKNNPKASEYLRNSDLEAFKKWQCLVTKSQEKYLTVEGEEEMIQLAERMQNRFPDLLPPIYSNTSYKFKYTATQRTQKSAISFATGLFDRKTVKDVWFPEPSSKDPILRFYKLCEKWRKEIKKNPNTLAHKNLFDSSLHMKEVVKDVTKRLNLSELIDINDLHLIYMTCAFETAWSKQAKSPWCSSFTKDSFKIKEYGEDLKYYWVDGYGHELTYKQACPAFGNMINFFQRSEDMPKSVTYFTHSGTLLKMIAHLGLYKDKTPLTYDQFEESRMWRVSKIDPFGTNLAFALFKCTNAGAGEHAEKYVATFHQERLIRLPACPDSDLCDLNTIIRYYDDSVNSCNFVDMCK